MEYLVYFTEEDARDYAGQFGLRYTSTDAELSEALRLKRFYEKQLNEPFIVAFLITQEGIRLLKAGKISKQDALNKYKKENSEVDYGVIRAADSHATQRDSFGGDFFQMKRLEQSEFTGNFKESIIKAIEQCLKKNYSKSNYLTLYLTLNFVSRTENPDWEGLHEEITQKKIPFTRILIGPISTQDGNQVLAEMYPTLKFKSL